MAAVYFDTDWYVHSGNMSTTGYWAVPAWTASTSTPPGTLRRQVSPTAGNERVFVAAQTSTGNTGTTEPTWSLTRGNRVTPTDGAVTWQECTGMAAVNGDSANTPSWATIKATGNTPNLGVIIKRNSGASYQICATAGTLSASEPAFSDTPGAVTNDGTTQWVCIGLVGSFAAWGAPHARLTNAVASTWGAAGNDFFVADNSAETSTAGITISLGSVASPCRYISVDHTAAMPPPYKAGASLTTSQASGNALQIGSSTQTSLYLAGFTFTASAATAAGLIVVGANQAVLVRCENCAFSLTGATASAFISIGFAGGNSTIVDLNNCTVSFGGTGQWLQFTAGSHTWRNTPNAIQGATIPTVFTRGSPQGVTSTLIEGVDLSALAANTLVSTANSGDFFTFKNCKLGTGPVIQAATSVGCAAGLDIVACDNGASVYRNERHTVCGDETTSAAIYRNGGAMDGVTPISRLLASTSFARQFRPYIGIPLVIWNDVTGSTRTVTIYGYVVGVGSTLPFNDQFWIEIEYMGTAGVPTASVVSTGLANALATHTQNAANDATSVWTGAGSPNTPFSLSTTFTAQQKGYITIYPKVGGASYSIQLDPRPVLS